MIIMAKFKTASILLISALWLGACASSGGDSASESGNGAMSEQANCEIKGGSYGPAGMLGADYCTMPYADAGMSCTDNAQCEGLCLAGRFDAAGYQGSGLCQADDNPFGCHSSIVNGEIQPGLCVD